MSVVIRNKMAVEIEPIVPDICTLISAAAAYHRPSGNEIRFLQGIRDSLDNRITELQTSSANPTPIKKGTKERRRRRK